MTRWIVRVQTVGRYYFMEEAALSGVINYNNFQVVRS